MISLFIIVVNLVCAQSSRPFEYDLYQRLTLPSDATSEQIDIRLKSIQVELDAFQVLNQFEMMMGPHADIHSMDAIFFYRKLSQIYNKTSGHKEMTNDQFIDSMVQIHRRKDLKYPKDLANAALVLGSSEERKVYDIFRPVLNQWFKTESAVELSPQEGITQDVLLSYQLFNDDVLDHKNIAIGLYSTFVPYFNSFLGLSPDLNLPMTLERQEPPPRSYLLANALVLLTHFTEAIQNLVEDHRSVDEWTSGINSLAITTLVEKEDLRFVALVVEKLIKGQSLKYHDLIESSDPVDRRFKFIRFIGDLLGHDSLKMHHFLDSATYVDDFVEAQAFLNADVDNLIYQKVYSKNVMRVFLEHPQFERFRSSGSPCLDRLQGL